MNNVKSTDVSYGQELILDIHDCDPSTFTRESIKKFWEALCIEIDMEREDYYFWDYKGDPEGYEAAPAHLKGISGVQFIKTSNITIHSLDELKKVFLNIFSCKSFDDLIVEEFSERWFKGVCKHKTFLNRV